MTAQEEARRLRRIIEQAVNNLDDKTASEAAKLFSPLKEDGSLIEAGTRINWKGSIKKAAVSLRDTEVNNPDNAPNLWEDIQYRDGIRIIPDVITATSAFMFDELGWWGDVIYKSLREGNIHTPEQAPDQWEIQNL